MVRLKTGQFFTKNKFAKKKKKKGSGGMNLYLPDWEQIEKPSAKQHSEGECLHLTTKRTYKELPKVDSNVRAFMP